MSVIVFACGRATLCSNEERYVLGVVLEPERNKQFTNINKLRDLFAQRGQPVISVDAKKRELVGLRHDLSANSAYPNTIWRPLSGRA